jgi:photosystem II stability/assembly factor-like uncharacterized protein
MRTLKISLLVFILPITISAQDFWEQTSGPFGGTTLSFAENSTGKIFVGTSWNLVFISQDNGVNWTQSDSGFINPYFRPSIDAIAINDTDHIFVSGYGTGVYRSLDDGKSWEQLSNGMYRYDIYALVIDENGFIYAGISDAGGVNILRSIDNGNSWEEKSNGLAAYDDPMDFAIYENIIYTVTYSGKSYYSTDQGENWIQILNTNNILLSITISDEGYIFVGGWNDKLYRSYNSGISWDTLLVTNDFNQIIISINSDLSGHLFAGTEGDPRFTKGILKSTDDGESWIPVNNGLTDLNITSLFVDSELNLYAGTFFGGSFKTINLGENWGQIGPILSQVNDMIVDESNIIFAGTENEVYRSTNYGISWEYSSSGISGISVQSLAYNVNGDIWAGTKYYDGGIFRSTDKGLTWEGGGFNILPTSIQCDDSGYVYASSFREVYRTTDDGITWSILSSPDGALIYITPDQTFYLGGLIEAGLYRSYDRGISWIKIFDQQINVVYVDESGNIFAGDDSGGGLYRSTDDGLSWESSDSGFVSKRIKAINGMQYSGLYCAVGYGDEIGKYSYYVSFNNGESWNEINSGVSNAGYSLEFDSNGFLYVGTTNRGVFRSVETTTCVPLMDIIPSMHFLTQNYPNPFNPITSMQYTIGSRQFVTLKVYDLLGREVATLVNEEKPAGEYEVEFNGATLPSGIYFYQLKAGQYSETKKMILLK